MNKMVFAFDEKRARRDGVDPASLWKMVDGWVDECAADYNGTYTKETQADGSVAYVGIGQDTGWWSVFFGVVMCGRFSDLLAKYGTKWDWYYEYDDDGDETCFEDVLAHQFENNDIYKRAVRA